MNELLTLKFSASHMVSRGILTYMMYPTFVKTYVKENEIEVKEEDIDKFKRKYPSLKKFFSNMGNLSAKLSPELKQAIEEKRILVLPEFHDDTTTFKSVEITIMKPTEAEIKVFNEELSNIGLRDRISLKTAGIKVEKVEQGIE